MGTDQPTLFPDPAAPRHDRSDGSERRADGAARRRPDADGRPQGTGRRPHAPEGVRRAGGRSGEDTTRAKPDERRADGETQQARRAAPAKSGGYRGATAPLSLSDVADGDHLGQQRGKDSATFSSAPSPVPSPFRADATDRPDAPTDGTPGGRSGEYAAGGEAGGNGPLDSSESKCWAPPLTCGDTEAVYDANQRRRERWQARAALWDASTLPGVRWCGRMMGTGHHDEGEHESVPIRRGMESAGYAGLATCGSVWACPRCSAVIAMERSTEIGRAVEACTKAGGAVYLLTLTMRHHAGHGLSELWDGLASGWRAVTGSEDWTGRSARTRTGKNGQVRSVPGVVGDRERFGIAGTIRSLEATYGRPAHGGKGWHLHAHVLIFTTVSLGSWLAPADVARALRIPAGDVTDAAKEAVGIALLSWRIFGRWIDGVTAAGLPSPSGAGLDLRPVGDGGAHYIGRYLQKSTFSAAARLGAEVGGGRNTKTTRRESSVTPFEMLADLSINPETGRYKFRVPRSSWMLAELPEGGWGVVDTSSGEVAELRAPGEWQRWIEWEQCSKGRRQILWSQRMKDPQVDREILWNTLLDARGRTEADEEIAAREISGSTVARIARESWFRHMTRRPEWLTDLLEVVEAAVSDEAATAAATAWGRERGVEIVPPIAGDSPPEGFRSAGAAE